MVELKEIKLDKIKEQKIDDHTYKFVYDLKLDTGEAVELYIFPLFFTEEDIKKVVFKNWLSVINDKLQLPYKLKDIKLKKGDEFWNVERVEVINQSPLGNKDPFFELTVLEYFEYLLNSPEYILDLDIKE